MGLATAAAGNRVEEPLFCPQFRLLDFQADYAAQCYYSPSKLIAADIGLGKSVITMATACALIEDGLIDLVVIGCESSKLGEWAEDIRTHTRLRPRLYVGPATARPLKKPKPGAPPRSRAEIRERLDEIDVLIGVYETLRGDLTTWVDAPDLARGHKKSRKEDETPKRLADGPLIEALAGRRVLYVTDEGPAKMGASRTSHLYQANERFMDRQRETGQLRVLCLSATPMDRDPEGYYNVCRLLQPMGRVEDFTKNHIAGWDAYRRPVMFKNLHPNLTEPGKVSLREQVGDLMLVKSKLDADVRERFPTVVSDFSYVRLNEKETAFYEWLQAEYADDEEGGVYTVLRQMCGHPLSLLRSQGGVAQDVARNVGEARLRALGASKAEALIARLQRICHGQGERVVVFTFFGQSILPILHEMMVAVGLKVSVNHGQMSAEARDISKRAFRDGATEVYLSSDAGARGINLPEASYIEEFDFPLKYSTHLQRVGRISRLSSINPTIWTNAWAVADTLEEDIISTMLRRKGWAEQVVVKEGISNEMIRKMLKERRQAA